MKRDPRPLIDQRLVRAVVHPCRVEILEALAGEEEGLGAGAIAEKLEISPAVVNYHVKVLMGAWAVEGVPAGAPPAELVFRLTPLSLAGDRNWRALSPSLQDDISTALLGSFMRKTTSSPPGPDGHDA